MRHRILLVGGTAVERGRLEGTLRNIGVSAMPAGDVPSAALLCRQFGPTAVFLLDEPELAAGRAHIGLLQSHPATSTTPLLLLEPRRLGPAMALLHTAVALVPHAVSGVDLVAILDAVFGEDPRDVRRRHGWHRRGPSTLRRLGDHLRLRQGTGTVAIGRAGHAEARLRFEQGRLVDAHADQLRGADAVKALLGDPTEDPWALAFAEGDGVPVLPALPTATTTPPAGAAIPEDIALDDDDGPTLPKDIEVDAPALVLEEEAMVEIALDDVVDDVVDDVIVGAPLGLPPLSAHHAAPTRLSILLVDDDPALITLYGRTFSHAGHTVHTAHDGEEGYEKARALRPDVIVSDIAMPKKNGWDLLAAVRQDPRLAETPFLLLSCHGDFLRGLSRVSAGADDYIEKGIRTGALKERLEAAVASRARLTTWTDTPPPSFRERLGGLGLCALLATLERTRADGEVFIDDGWTKLRLWLVGGTLVHCLIVEADGTSYPGQEALVAALGLPEADVEWRAGEAPPGPTTMVLPPAMALEEAARTLEERRLMGVEAALARSTGLRFREGPTTLFLLVADDERARLVRRMAAGEAPRDLLASGDVDPLLLEWLVQDVLAKGVASLSG
jgi:CheY-like chemotaxis protein